jgi:hypothetical protein
MFIGCAAAEYPVPPGAAPGSPPSGDGDLAVATDDVSSGTGVRASQPVGEAAQAQTPCPDPPNCTAGNGTGIYAAEGGFAGIAALVPAAQGARAIMITRFIVQTPARPGDVAVTFTYGYFEPTSNAWIPLSPPGVGRVESADYRLQRDLQVIGAQEINTAPIWVLRNPASGTTVSVTDKQLVDLILHVSFTIPGRLTPVLATLSFSAASATPLIENFKTSVRVYDMRWQNLSDSPGAAPQSYCHRPDRAPDTAVFQQGLAVDPVNGTVTRSSAAGIITLSCSLGAPAVVARWGYPYHGSSSDTFYFDAGIHMKRASYCGDAHYYTVAGTRIQITDDRPIQRESIAYLEAQWTPSGARCVDYHSPDYLRHPEMGFTGRCGSRMVNPCTGPVLLPYLADGPVTLLFSP